MRNWHDDAAIGQLNEIVEDMRGRNLRCGKGRVVRTLCAGGGGTPAPPEIAARLDTARSEFNALDPAGREARLMSWAASLPSGETGSDVTAVRQELVARNLGDLTTLATRQAVVAKRKLPLAKRTRDGAQLDGELQNHLAKLRLGHGITDPGTALAIRGLLDNQAARGVVHRCLSCGRFVAGDTDAPSCAHCASVQLPATSADAVSRTLKRSRAASGGLVSKPGEANQYGEVYSAAVSGHLPQDVAQVMAGVEVPDAESPSMLAYYENYIRNLTGLDAKLHFGEQQWTSWTADGIVVEIDPYPLTRAAAYRTGLVPQGVPIPNTDIARLRGELADKGVEISVAEDVVEAIGDATHEAAHMLHSTISSTTAAHLFAAGAGPVSGLDGKKVSPKEARQQLAAADLELWQRCQGWLEQPVDPDASGAYSALKRREFNRLHNILADGHDERCHLEGDLNRIIAADRLFERWQFDPDNDPDYLQLQGAMLYEALPAKAVPLAQLKPGVRDFFERELRPLVHQAIGGSSTDLTVAAFQIYDKLNAAGYFDREMAQAQQEGRAAFDTGGGGEVCENITGGAAPGQGGTPGQPGAGMPPASSGAGGQAGAAEGTKPGGGSGGQAGSKPGAEEGQGSGGGEQSSPPSAGGGQGGEQAGQGAEQGAAGGSQNGDQPASGNSASGEPAAQSGSGPAGAQGSDQQAGERNPADGASGASDEAKREALQQAQAALDRAHRQEERALGGKLRPGSFQYAGPQGTATAAPFAQRTARLRTIANRFAVEIDRIKTQAIRDRKFQTQGRLDRRRLVAAAKGSGDVYIDPGRTLALDMAAVMFGDTSGSMSGREQQLADALTVCSLAFDKTGVAHELGSFNDETYLHKSFGQRTAEGVEQLPKYTGGTAMTEAIAFGTKRLAPRKEKNRVLYVATDGRPGDFQSCRQAVLAARRQGITVFGIFMGSVGMPMQAKQAARAQMAGLFDQDQVVLERIEDIPTVVGGQLIRSLKEKVKK